MTITEAVRNLEQPRLYTDLMIDLETLGLTANSVVLSIGAALFDIENKDMGPTFYENVDRESCYGLGMEVNLKTVEWWEHQSLQARAGLLDPKPVPVGAAMRELCSWLKDHTEERDLRVWSHGATFDIPLVRTMSQKTGVMLPWNYWNEHDTRTLVLVAEKRGRKSPKPRMQPEIPHHAISDAIAQAQWMQNTWETLNG